MLDPTPTPSRTRRTALTVGGILAALAAAFGIYKAQEEPAPLAPTPVEERIPAPDPPPATRLGLSGAGNIPTSADAAVISARLDITEGLNLFLIRAQTGGGAWQGQGISRAEALIRECERRGIKVIFGVHGRAGELADRSDVDLSRASSDWAALARRYPETVVGFALQREIDHLDDPSRQAEVVRNVIAFARGLRAAGYTGVVTPGGLGYRPEEGMIAGDILRQFAPYIAAPGTTPTVEKPFTGVGLHYYRSCRWVLQTGDLDARIRENIARLKTYAGVPEAVPVYIYETNSNRANCTSDAEQVRSLDRLLPALSRQARVVLAFTPYRGDDDRFLLAGEAAASVGRWGTATADGTL
jgi:hypothetical protein